MPIVSTSSRGGPAAGTYLPVADQSGTATLDTTTYNDPIRGSGKLATLVLASQRSAAAVAVSGDAFPRWLFAGTPDDGLYLGDGTFDPYNNAQAVAVSVGVNGANHYLIFEGGVGNMQLGVNGLVNVTGLILAASSGINTGSIISSGALPTVAPVSGTAFQCSTTRDVFLVVPVTYNPTAGAAATCLTQVSPDNVTFSTVGTETEPAGVAFDGTIHLLTLQVPAAWRVKLTVTNATLGTGTYY